MHHTRARKITTANDFRRRHGSRPVSAQNPPGGTAEKIAREEGEQLKIFPDEDGVDRRYTWTGIE
jgi:hypothetical protein